jgi:hypothetical protein
MSEAKRFSFPRLRPASNTPAWMDPANNAGKVRTLLQHLSGEEPAANENNAQQAQPEPAPAYDPAPPAFEVPVEEPRVMSRLPPPPTLGSLIPGARSNPPPANDSGHALTERAEAFANAAIELAIARAATITVLEDQLLDLAIEVASALVERELEAAPELHVALARAALASLGDCSQVTLRTSHDGYQTICAAFGGEEVEVRGVRVHVVADESIPGLGCVLDGENVRVDATVSERLRAVRRAFAEERRKTMEAVE